MPDDLLLHGTAIAVAGQAALLRGPSGAGKSDLALRCLGLPPSPLLGAPARLVADDQVLAHTCNGEVVLRAPPTLFGLLEVRGLGILPVPAVAAARLALLVDLVARHRIERLPDRPVLEALSGVGIPRLLLAPFEASAPLKLLLGLATTPRLSPRERIGGLG